MLTGFVAVPEAGDLTGRGPLIHCYDKEQLVLAVVAREALDDAFPDRRLTREQRNLLASRNLDALTRLIDRKYKSGAIETFGRLGKAYPLVIVTSSDIRNSGEMLSDRVLDLAAGFAGQDGRV